MVDCPQCGAVVLPATMVGGVAQCVACEHLFELPSDDPRVTEASTRSAEASPEPAEASAGRPEPIPQPPVAAGAQVYVPLAPSGAYVTTHGNGLELTLPWRDDVHALGHLFQIFLVVAFGMMASRADSLGAGAFLVGLALMVGYSWVYTMVNRTTVWIGPGGVEVSHGPLPSFSFGASYRAEQLRPVSVQAVVKGFGRSRRTVYELHAGRTGTQVLGDWNHREPIAFVRDCIVAVIDRPAVAGALDSVPSTGARQTPSRVS